MSEHARPAGEGGSRSAYRIQQSFHYRYPAPISELDHRLMIVPQARFGDQRLLYHSLSVSPGSRPETRIESSEDAFGNVVFRLLVPRVEAEIEFQSTFAVERHSNVGPHLVAGSWLTDRRLLAPSPLTQPSAGLVLAAAQVASAGAGDLAAAEAIGSWVHSRLRYRPGATDVRTSAAQALDLGEGVCQDFAHVMLALCRLNGLPCRYVSGHLLGEGGSHAWVEVLTSSARPQLAEVWAYDPTVGAPVGLEYVTVAVGRDYTDVTPTAGVFRAAQGGQLSVRKTASVI